MNTGEAIQNKWNPKNTNVWGPSQVHTDINKASDWVSDLKDASDLLMVAEGIISQGEYTQSLIWKSSIIQWQESYQSFEASLREKYHFMKDETCIKYSLRKRENFPENTVNLIEEFKSWCNNCQKLSDALFGTDPSIVTINEAKQMFPCQKG